MKNRAPSGSGPMIRARIPVKPAAVLAATLTLLLIAVLTASAAATFGPVTGPIYLNPGYQLDAEVTAMSDPHNNVCIDYTVSTGGSGLESCTCSLPECDPASSLGSWACVIPGNYPSATINWVVSAYPGGSCTGTSLEGPSGNFTTDPTALELVGFTGAGWGGFTPTGMLVVLGVLGAAVVVLVVLWNTRRRRGPGVKA